MKEGTKNVLLVGGVAVGLGALTLGAYEVIQRAQPETRTMVVNLDDDALSAMADLVSDKRYNDIPFKPQLPPGESLIADLFTQEIEPVGIMTVGRPEGADEIKMLTEVELVQFGFDTYNHVNGMREAAGLEKVDCLQVLTDASGIQAIYTRDESPEYLTHTTPGEYIVKLYPQEAKALGIDETVTLTSWLRAKLASYQTNKDTNGDGQFDDISASGGITEISIWGYGVTPELAVTLWYNSISHRNVMLGPYKDLGIIIAQGADGRIIIVSKYSMGLDNDPTWPKCDFLGSVPVPPDPGGLGKKVFLPAVMK